LSLIKVNLPVHPAFFIPNKKTMNTNHRNGKILALLFTGVLMGALDISIVGPAIPAIEQTLKVDHRMLSWIFSMYVLFNLVGVSLLAKLSDQYGRRNIYIFSVSIFALGSALVSFAGNIEMLLLGRAVQGFGASGIFPVASAVIGDIYPPEKRGRTLGMIGAVFGIAFIIGPIIAGVVLKYFSWNSLFLVNLPIAAVVIFFSFKLLPSQRSLEKPHFDIPGMILLALLLASFAYGINNIEASGGIKALLATNVYPFLLVAAISLATFVFVENRSKSPIVKIKLFDVKQIRIVGFVAFMAGILQAVTIFVPQMAVNLYGVTTSKASFMLIPFVLAIAVGAPISGRLVDRAGSRVVVFAGLTLAVIGLFIISVNPKSLFYFYTSGILLGIGTSMLQGSSIRYIMLNEVISTERALGQGIITLLTSTGQMTGATMIGLIIASMQLPIMGYSRSFLIVGLIGSIALLFSTRLKSRKEELASASKQEK